MNHPEELSNPDHQQPGCDHEWVDTQSRFNELCQQWSGQEFLAIDTEFVRTRTFYPKLGLLQVADAQGRYLIDPLTIEDFQPLKLILENPDIVKVLHAASEDTEIFSCFINARTQRLFDTQVGAAYLGFGTSIGYANLVKQKLQVELPKDETRSDWLQRPLSENQKLYAARDVEYLYDIYLKQKVELEKQQRIEWVFEDSDRIVAASLPQDPDSYYLKIRQAWQMRGQKLWLLKTLAAWRERLAMAKDLPRTRVIRDALVFEIAQSMPGSIGRLNRIQGLYPAFARRYGEQVLAMIEKSRTVGREDYPARIPGPLKVEAGQMLKTIRDRTAELAQQLDLPSELLARKKWLEALVASGMFSGEFHLPEPLTGWRKERVGEPLLETLAQEWQNINTLDEQ